jgi:hypothetical protein
MIAITKQPRQTATAQENEQFLNMLPLIRNQARLAFRGLQAEHKDELIQEIIANAYCAFVKLVRRGKASIAYATPLTNFAIRQVLRGDASVPDGTVATCLRWRPNSDEDFLWTV